MDVITQNFTLKAEKLVQFLFIFLRNFLFISQFQAGPPPEQTFGDFFDRANPPLPRHKDCPKPRSSRQKCHARTPAPGQLFSKSSRKKHKT